jgi:AcrR family transcriptional regulator
MTRAHPDPEPTEPAAEPRRRPGRPRVVTREAILAAARASHHDGLTMKGLAAQLGVSHTALYNHFRSRAELFAALAAEETAQIEIPPLKGRSWQEWLIDYAYLRRDLLVKYRLDSWLPAASVGPSVRISDACLRVLLDAGFDPTAATRYMRIIGGCCAISGGTIEQRRRYGFPSSPDVQRDYYDTAGLPSDAPLREHVSLLLDPDEDTRFRGDVVAVIEGMEAHLQKGVPRGA